MATKKNTKAPLAASGEGQAVRPFRGSGSASSTQDRNEPVNGTAQQPVNEKLFVRTVDREPKDIAWLQASIIGADSVYYPNQQRLFDMYSDILIKDAFLRGIINKRISQVVNKRLLCLFNDEEQPVMMKVVRTKAFKDIMRQIIWTKMWGLNGLEFIPGKNLAFNLIPKKHIKLKTQKISYEQTSLDDGIDYTKFMNIWVLGDSHDIGGNGSSHDYGLLVICAYLSLLKKGNISDWAQYIEIFGSPAIVVKYAGYDQQAKLAADKIMDQVANSMRMTVPKEMDVTFEDGKMTNGDGKLQDAFRQACNEEQSILILGNTETTGHSKTGTGAKSEVHSKQQLEIIKDDMDDIVDALNSEHFMNILRSYNLPVDGCTFEFDREVDIDYLERKANVDIAFITAGAKVSKKYIHENYAMPEPDGPDDVFEYNGGMVDEQATTKPPQGKPAAKPKLQAKLSGDSSPATIADVKALLTDFFGPARS